jgi:hypothetical protein
MLSDERPMEREKVDQHEVWSAIRYLDPDERDKDREAKSTTTINRRNSCFAYGLCCLGGAMAAGTRAMNCGDSNIEVISVHMLTLFVMFITSGKESLHFHETSGPREERHTCRSQPRCMHLGCPQMRS